MRAAADIGVGDLQTYFYLVLLGGALSLWALLLAGVGLARLVPFARQGEHRLMATLIGGMLVLAIAFVLAAAVGLVVVGTGHAT